MAATIADKKEILTATGEAIAELTRLMLLVEENKINTIPFEGSWTAPQVLSHVTKSINRMAAVLLMDAKPAERDPGERIPQLKMVFLDLTNKLQSPDFILPEAGYHERQAVIDQLNESFKQFLENANKATLNELVEGLPLGPITKTEIIHFVLFHTQRHLEQMKKICEALKSE